MKITIYGKLDPTEQAIGGQLDKTKIIVSAMNQFADETISFCNLYKRNSLLSLIRTAREIIKSDKNICIVSYRGIIIFTVLFQVLSKIKKSEYYCIVVGNIEAEQLAKHGRIFNWFCSLNGVFFESKLMCQKFKSAGCYNSFYFPNCRKIKTRQTKHIPKEQIPIKFCTYSRVAEEKGILDAIIAVKEVNRLYQSTVCLLDIYGPVEVRFKEKLAKAIDEEDYIKLCGPLDSDEANDVLENYTALLFPTHHKGEGVPGCVLIALESGLPIIATNINSNPETIDNGRTGFLYDENDSEKLIQIIREAIENPQILWEMRKSCRESVYRFDIQYNIVNLMKILGIPKKKLEQSEA